MRLQICIGLLFLCLATLPSVQCQNKKYKVQEYNERDRKDTRERYSKRDLGQDKKPKYRGRTDDEDEEVSERRYTKKEYRTRNDENRPVKNFEEAPIRRRNTRREEEEEVPVRARRSNVRNEPEPKLRRKYQARKLQESDEDDDTDEDNDSEVCSRKGGKCDDSPEDDDNTDEDLTDEDDTDEEDDVPVKKRVTYVKKFAHEKKKKKEDKEIGSILKIHKKSGADVVKDKRGTGLRFRAVDDDSSEEVGLPKRRRVVYEDDDE